MITDKELNEMYNSLFPSFTKEKEIEAKQAFEIYKSNNKNKRAKNVIINAYLDIIRFTIGEYAYNNHISFLSKNKKNIEIEFDMALKEFKLI